MLPIAILARWHVSQGLYAGCHFTAIRRLGVNGFARKRRSNVLFLSFESLAVVRKPRFFRTSTVAHASGALPYFRLLLSNVMRLGL